MQLTIVGCGDAFGSGGRLQTCYQVETGGRRFLIDCGATAMIGFARLGLDPNRIDTIFISHLHGDHFGGLVWWMLHGQFVAIRTQPLTVIGPPTIAARFHAATEALFPGSSAIKRRFALSFEEYRVGEAQDIGGVRLSPSEVVHPSGAPSCALRVETGGRVLSFSGDTEWTEALVGCATGADLFITECFGHTREVPYHLSWRTLSGALDRLGARRYLLTHMNAEMLAARHTIADPRVLLAEDGMVLDV